MTRYVITYTTTYIYISVTLMFVCPLATQAIIRDISKSDMIRYMATYIFTYIHKYLVIYEVIYVVWGKAPEPHRRCGIYKHNLID